MVIQINFHIRIIFQIGGAKKLSSQLQKINMKIKFDFGFLDQIAY